MPALTVKFKRPVVGFTTSGYGPRGSSFHHGTDIAAPHGAVIVAVADGVVEQAGPNGGYGNYISITHGKLGAGPSLATRYAHLSKIGVRVGDKVAAGQLIGNVGSTGDSTGPHLHFEVRLNGNSTNPAPWLAGATTADISQVAETGGNALTAPIDAIKDVAGLIKSITDGSLWIRLIMIVAGFLFMLFAVFALIGKSKQSQVIKLVSSGASKAGSVTAGEAVVAGAA